MRQPDGRRPVQFELEELIGVGRPHLGRIDVRGVGIGGDEAPILADIVAADVVDQFPVQSHEALLGTARQAEFDLPVAGLRERAVGDSGVGGAGAGLRQPAKIW